MPELYWNPLSINYLVQLIFAAAISAYFVGALQKSRRDLGWTRETLPLACTFFSCVLGLLLQLLATALHPSLGDYFLPWVGPAGVGAMGGFLLFAFYFKRPLDAKKWTEWMMLGGLALLLCAEVLVAWQRSVLLTKGFVEFREAWLPVPFSVGFALAVALLFIRLTQQLGIDDAVSPRHGLVRALVAIAWPRQKLSKNATAIRAFFYVSLMPFAVGTALLLRAAGLLDWTTALIIGSWFTLLTFATLALAYLNYIPERSSFLVKLVGITLTTLLCILSAVSWFLGSINAEAYQSPNMLSDRTMIAFQPLASGGYQAQTLVSAEVGNGGVPINDLSRPVQLPFEFPFFGTPHCEIYISDAGMIGFQAPPLWRNIAHRLGPHPAIFVVTAALQSPLLDDATSTDSGVFVQSNPQQTTITWRNLVSSYRPESRFSFALTLAASGTITMHFTDLPDRVWSSLFDANAAPLMTGLTPGWRSGEPPNIQSVRFAADETRSIGSGEAMIESHREDFLDFINQIYEPVAYLIIGSSVLVLFVFPRFFRVSLDRPLEELLQGVRGIIGGKLETTIPVQHNDEIGYLAEAFNEMASAQQNLVTMLENKVAQRTDEASSYAIENARLEERNHLSRELHDAVSQTLFAAGLIADTLPTLQKSDDQQFEAAVADMRRLNKDALGEMRELVNQLRTHEVKQSLFSELLENAAKRAENSFAVSINCTVENDFALPPAIQSAFYRVTQECLANAAKHAGADEIDVYFDGMENQAMLRVRDKGRGFDSTTIKPGHLGLGIMRERMEEIGGSLIIEAKPGHGTTIEAIWIEDERAE